MSITRMRGIRFIGAAGTLALGLGAAVAAPPAGATEASLPVPSVLGGPGHALVYPSGMEVGPSNEVVVADTGNDSVAKFSAAGTLIWRVAAGSSDGDEAENARDIAIDDAGNSYVGDAALSRVIKLSSAGKVLATWRGPSTDPIGSPIGLSHKAGKIYVADGLKRRVRVFDTSGRQLSWFGDDGACQLANVRDADADAAGNVYVANYTNNNIAKFSATGRCLGTWGSAGSGSGQFKNPYGVRVATDRTWGESVYVADSNNNRIQVFSTSGTYRTSVGAPGAPNQPGTFTTLRRVAVGADGDVWGADLWGWRLERFDRTASGYAYAQTIGGTPPPATDTKVFNEPRAVALTPTGNLDIVDTVNQRIVTMSPSGQVLRTCGVRDARPVSLNWPRGVAVDQTTGERWIADTKQSRLQIFPATCGEATRLGGVGTGTSQFNWPHSIAIRQSDRLAFVADTKNNRLTVWDVATRRAIGTYTAARLKQPRSVTVDEHTGRVLVADTGNNRIVELSYSRSGGFALTRAIAPGLTGPEGAAADAAGNVWIADTGRNRVLVVNRRGGVVDTVTAAAGKSLKGPAAVSTFGGVTYVSDTGNDRVLRYAAGAARGETIPAPAATTPGSVTTTGDADDATDPVAGQKTPAGPRLEKVVHAGGFADMYPVDVATTSSHYYAIDPGRYRLVGVNRSTKAIDYQVGGSRGSETGELGAARAVAAGVTNERIYLADTPNNRVVVYDRTLRRTDGWGSKGTGNGQFTMVYGIATGPGIGDGGADAQVVYTVDGNRVQKFTTGGTWLATFGTSLNQPRQIEVSKANGDVFVVNARDRKVVVYDKYLREKFRFGGTGSGNGQFQGDPRGITISPGGSVVFVTDDGNRRIQAFSGSTGAFRYAISGGLVDPRGIDVTADNYLVVADEWAYALKEYRYSSTNAILTRTLFGQGPPKSGVNSPRGMGIDGQGRLFVSDWWNQRIVRSNRDGGNYFAWGRRGTRGEPGTLNFAWGLAIQPRTNRVFVANRESHEITVFSATGQWLTKWGTRGSGPGQFTFPQGLAFDNDGSLLVVDSGNDRIQRFTISASGAGSYRAAYGRSGTGLGEFNMPTGIDVDPSGRIWVADTLNNRLQRYSGGTWTAVTRAGGSNAAFRVPWGVTVAPDKSIWVADTGNKRLVRLSAAGAYGYEVTGPSAGTSTFGGPFQTVFDASGDLFVSDTWGNRVLRLGW